MLQEMCCNADGNERKLQKKKKGEGGTRRRDRGGEVSLKRKGVKFVDVGGREGRETRQVLPLKEGMRERGWKMSSE